MTSSSLRGNSPASRSQTSWAALGALALVPSGALATGAGAPGNHHGPDVPTRTIDLRNVAPATHSMVRVHGPGRDEGDAGVPVAGGFDADGDGRNDYAVGHFLSDPLGRTGAGEVNLVFGDASMNDVHNLAVASPSVLRIIGSGNLGEREGCGSEIWMGDVTGDGLGDLVICRQNYSFATGAGNRIGAGAVTIIVGSPQLRTLAAAGQIIDLASPPAGVHIVDLLGPHNNARMGIWARTGDVDGDGIDDLLAAADQENSTGTHAGAAYVLRGGPHLHQSIALDMASFGTTPLATHVARIIPPDNSSHFHLGATNQVGDLDGNGRAELLLAAALNRSGAAVGPSSGTTHATGGAPPNGWAFVVWDDNFPLGAWPAGHLVAMQSPPGSLTTIRGGSNNDTFGEELLGGKDYDGDGNAELFVGDLTGDGDNGNRFTSGIGYVFYNAAALRGLDFDVDNAVALNIPHTVIWGPRQGAIGADTVADGDLDGDGFDDLIFGSPTDRPLNRNNAGSVQIFFGQAGGWPQTIDTAPGAFPLQSTMRITEVIGARGNSGFSDTGDTLCYSAAAGDMDGDGKADLLVNEMRGNGVGTNTQDAGNLLVLTGSLLSDDTMRIGTNYCTATPNSTGVPGVISALGSTSIASADVQLEASSLPLGAFGYFLASTTQGFTAMPGGSAGNLCLAGDIGRFVLSVGNSGTFGSFTLWIDPAVMPAPTGVVAIQPGETWSFQAWHRDQLPVGVTSNFTNGLAVTFN